MAANALKPHFPVGKRQISFPKFTVTMIKSALPPNYARFIVPLSFNKLDLRDYLFHVYNVRTLHIRSAIIQGKAFKNEHQRLVRGPATKYMTAQLLEPFVWPEEPWVKQGIAEEDWDGFQRGMQEASEEAERGDETVINYDRTLRRIRDKMKPKREHREKLEEQARRLLSGEEKWQSTSMAMGREEFWSRKTSSKAR
ncbi:uncharacterized protein PV09_02392 [Verruconis gallopava]|uniref:Large ribosomal subunit protein uL23m n=1 Tax=Verruconis gallopava TaxID=253628 RepID=A0A0D1Z149_9PEZI|nr:uncharacterized protein PV09_02392 [Verruconis gallopava]KIW06687.1 hypothetical protein PV09_02392 [Verruconis gallopava]